MRVRIIGVGMGPQHLTAEAVAAIGSLDYVIAAEKSDDDGLLALRREVLAAAGRPVDVVAVPDPQRDRSATLTGSGYVGAVADWHDARAAAYADVLRARGGTAGFLVWGDPSLYDSTIRIVEKVKSLGVELDYDVIPGISAPQLLAARHRIVLHPVGEPVHITAARRLPHAAAAGQDNIVAMLAPEQLDLTGFDDWTVWWGANLGAPGERLVSGRLADVRDEIVAARAAAKAEAGWVMDLFLLRKP